MIEVPAVMNEGEVVLIPIDMVRKFVDDAYGDTDFIKFCLEKYEEDPTYFDDEEDE